VVALSDATCEVVKFETWAPVMPDPNLLPRCHRLDAEIKAGTARPSTRDYVSAIRLYLIPFYGAYNIDGIKPAVISEFHTWRSVKVGRELSGSAQNNHNAALNLIFDRSH
jgi:hypothetical protein